ncbi:hypothetical protein LTR09_001783 [Extremus antarcticus]|uniref:F-box domain-containing protein n=1 Tax=Extremus antarcticus TaxID=702011 RepID=A0AAJ0LW65_9PEZI|nr:hypothetical protein LTR09_001783 [Extremus antarcticus]
MDGTHTLDAPPSPESPTSSTDPAAMSQAGRRRLPRDRYSFRDRSEGPSSPRSRARYFRTEEWEDPQPNRRSAASPWNPAAPEFTPSGSMRIKRKASSPNDPPPGKATQGSSGAASQHARDVPVFETVSLFARNAPTTATDDVTTAMIEQTILDDDQLDYDSDQDFTMPRTFAAAQTPATDNSTWARTQYLNRTEAMKAARATSSRKLSAVLVSSMGSPSNTSLANPHKDVNQVRYLALCPAKGVNINADVESNSQLTVLPAHRRRFQQSQQIQEAANVTWPLHELPVELFDLITAELSRDDVKSMRLVSREFEQKVSRSLFHTSVVPFNTELYDMIDEDKKIVHRPFTGKGKGRAIDQDITLSGLDSHTLQWANAKDDEEGKVYKGHGLRVFQGFGPHIRRFGMSFDVSEKQLSQPLSKKELEHVTAYHGSYDWPSQHYTRFANLAGLENTADETSKMKSAFANLEHVQELALSIDSGLGWLSGPDKSVRARIFERQSPVFGTVYDVPDHGSQAAAQFWQTLQSSQLAFDARSNMKEIALEGHNLPTTVQALCGNLYANTRLWPTVQGARLISPDRLSEVPSLGIIFTTSRVNERCEFEHPSLPLVPSALKKEQREWLLETQWAQQAFLESYMLAIIDNPGNFGQVTTLNIAKLSSRFLPMLARPYLWDALPCLHDVVLRISPDWRSVDKDDSGAVVGKWENPTEAVRIFHKGLLCQRISSRESIKKLTIGWVGGGEHAEGIFARNNNLLPAPITALDHCTANSTLFGVVFKRVEHLTLSNCWITPPALKGLIKSHEGHALKKLTLDSVSLTTHPKFTAAANVQGAAGVQFQQALAAAQTQFANNLQAGPAMVPVNTPNLVGLNAQQTALLQQQWQLQVQQMQQIFQNQAVNQLQANLNIGAQPVLNANGAPNFNNMANFPPLPPAGGANAIVHPPAPAVQLNQFQVQLPAHVQMQMPIPNAANAASVTPSHWTEGYRDGSWPDVLNKISPGPIFSDYRTAPEPWEEQLPERPESSLQTIELKSCGYAKLAREQPFDQSALEVLDDRHIQGRPWFMKRWASLKAVMMDKQDKLLGKIVQRMDQRELYALQYAWGLTESWADAGKAEEATFDGGKREG